MVGAPVASAGAAALTVPEINVSRTTIAVAAIGFACSSAHKIGEEDPNPFAGTATTVATGSGDLFLTLMLGMLDASAQQPTSGEPAPEGPDSATTDPTDAAVTTSPEVGALVTGFVALSSNSATAAMGISIPRLWSE